MPYKIALVDDRPQVLIALIEELDNPGEIIIVFTAKNGEEYLQKMKGLERANYPQVVLMDIDMPVMDGIEAVRIGSLLYTGVEYIMFTVFDGDDKLFEALRAGARGYLLKKERGSAILNAIEELVDRQGAPMSSSIARKTLGLLINSAQKSKEPPPAETTLTDRETEILKGLVAGLDYKQLAVKFLLSPNTIRNHIANIYTKLHVTSKGQAIKLAIKNKWA